jgi:hypothetical protein
MKRNITTKHRPSTPFLIGILLLSFLGTSAQNTSATVITSYSVIGSWKQNKSGSDWRETVFLSPVSFSELSDSSYRIRSYDLLKDLIGNSGEILNTSEGSKAVFKIGKLDEEKTEGDKTIKSYWGQLWFNTMDGKTPVRAKMNLWYNSNNTLWGIYLTTTSTPLWYSFKLQKL